MCVHAHVHVHTRLLYSNALTVGWQLRVLKSRLPFFKAELGRQTTGTQCARHIRDVDLW